MLCVCVCVCVCVCERGCKCGFDREKDVKKLLHARFMCVRVSVRVWACYEIESEREEERERKKERG
jgi:hypothetical protein